MKNAPWVEAGDKGKFYMVHGGRNRVVFLAAKDIGIFRLD